MNIEQKLTEIGVAAADAKALAEFHAETMRRRGEDISQIADVDVGINAPSKHAPHGTAWIMSKSDADTWCRTNRVLKKSPEITVEEAEKRGIPLGSAGYVRVA